MTYKATTFGSSALAGPLTTSSTSLTVLTGTGDRFPAITTGEETYLVLKNADNTKKEIVRVTDREPGVDAMTIERGKFGFAAQTWTIGDIVSCRPIGELFAQAINDRQQHEAAVDPHPQYTTGEEVAAAVAPVQTTANGALQKSGGTMTGAITLAGDASSALHAVPKQQLDAAIAAIPPPPAVPLYTGMGMDWWLPNAPDGWVFASGRTIGNAASGATERANADCQALFIALWDAYPDTILPVSGGRGASAADDWAANKTIALIDKRGRVSAGKDDMGGTAANRITAAGAGITGTTLGAAGGTQTHTLTIAQMPSHNHSGSFTSHTPDDSGGSVPYIVSSSGRVGGSRSNTVTIGYNGSGGAHQNTQPSIVCNYIIKL